MATSRRKSVRRVPRLLRRREAEPGWALATRFQADRDLVVQSGFRALPLDPSLGGAVTGAKAGFDLTVPFGRAATIETLVPEPPRHEGTRFPSIEAARSRDVRALESLRTAGRLARDRDGRYPLAPSPTSTK